jgi:hypothetical protein
LLFASFGYFYQGAGPHQYSRFDLVRAAVDRRTFVIDDYAKNTIDKAEADGHFYSDKAPGLALASTPVYFVVRLAQRFATPSRDSARAALYLITLIVVGGASAAAGAFVFLFQRRLGIAPLPALLAVAAYALGSNHFAYATLYVGHAFVAALLVIAFTLLHRAEARHRRTLAVAGLLVGWAAISEYPAGALAVFLALYGARRLGTRALAPFAIAAAVPLVVLAVYNTSCFGSPFTLGYDRLPSETYRTAMARGFYGVALPSPVILYRLLFGEQRGILPLAPWILLVAPGLLVLWRRHRLESILVGTCILFPLLLASSYAVWHGGMAMGPRHFVVALPFAGIATGVALDVFMRRVSIFAAAIASILYAIVVCLACVAVMPEFPDAPIPIRVADMSAPDPEHPLTTLVLPLLARGHVSVKGTTPAGHIGYAIGFEGHDDDAINLGERLGLRGLLSLVPLLLVWIFAAIAARARPGPERAITR